MALWKWHGKEKGLGGLPYLTGKSENRGPWRQVGGWPGWAAAACCSWLQSSRGPSEFRIPVPGGKKREEGKALVHSWVGERTLGPLVGGV